MKPEEATEILRKDLETEHEGSEHYEAMCLAAQALEAQARVEPHHLAALNRGAEYFDAWRDRLANGDRPYDAMFPEGDANALREIKAWLSALYTHPPKETQ